MNVYVRTGIFSLLLILVFSTCSITHSGQLPGPSDYTIETQKRINKYFHDKVIPHLEKCWNRIQGRGLVRFEYIYNNDDQGNWGLTRLFVDESSLEKTQTTLALECMLNATKQAKLQLKTYESVDREFILHWTWPVPAPEFTDTDLAAMMGSSGGSGGGCDGKGAAKKCFTCKDFKCIKVCVGYKKCTLEYESGQSGHDCIAHTPCASGGPFGLGGSDVIF